VNTGVSKVSAVCYVLGLGVNTGVSKVSAVCYVLGLGVNTGVSKVSAVCYALGSDTKHRCFYSISSLLCTR
jgi:hypothetical protein